MLKKILILFLILFIYSGLVAFCEEELSPEATDMINIESAVQQEIVSNEVTPFPTLVASAEAEDINETFDPTPLEPMETITPIECEEINEKNINGEVIIYSEIKGNFVYFYSELINFDDISTITYQWQKRVQGTITDIIGANQSTYSFKMTHDSIRAEYRVVITWD